MFLTAIFVNLGLFVLSAGAATLTVTNTNDSGAGSLRAAIATANSTMADDIIEFAIPSTDPNCTASGVCTITMTGSGQFQISSTTTAGKLTITNSTGADKLIISGNNITRVFYNSGNLTLSGFTITKGNSVTSSGGGLFNDASTLTLNNVIVTGNTSPQSGGGIFNSNGTLNLNNSTISENTSNTIAGGIFNQGFGGVVTITNSTISGNRTTSVSGGNGGGIYNGGDGTMTITNSTVTGNSSIDGGGIYSNLTSSMNITNSTIMGNTSVSSITGTGGTGGIFAAGTMNITNSTISGNTGIRAGGIYYSDFTSGTSLSLNSVTVTNNNSTDIAGGIEIGLGTVIINNTIIAGNTVANSFASPDLRGSISSTSSYNLIGNNQGMTGITHGTNGNQVGTAASPIDPRLEPLADNLGPTKTHALKSESPALDKGKSFSETTDQRGLPRPVQQPVVSDAVGGDGADIGAFEMQAVLSAGVTLGGRVLTLAGRGLVNAQVVLTVQDGTTHYARTTAGGHYQFAGVEAGTTVILTVISKRYSFTPRVLTVTEELTGVDFVAQSKIRSSK